MDTLFAVIETRRDIAIVDDSQHPANVQQHPPRPAVAVDDADRLAAVNPQNLWIMLFVSILITRDSWPPKGDSRESPES